MLYFVELLKKIFAHLFHVIRKNNNEKWAFDE